MQLFEKRGRGVLGEKMISVDAGHLKRAAGEVFPRQHHAVVDDVIVVGMKCPDRAVDTNVRIELPGSTQGEVSLQDGQEQRRQFRVFQRDQAGWVELAQPPDRGALINVVDLWQVFAECGVGRGTYNQAFRL